MSNFTLADEYVIDTVGLALHLEKRKSGTNAERVCESAQNGLTIIHIPAMVLAEILYLSERGRISTGLEEVGRLLEDFSNFKEFPMNRGIIQSAAQITDIPELHDRLISATARFIGAELITNDPTMENSAFVKIIW